MKKIITIILLLFYSQIQAQVKWVQKPTPPYGGKQQQICSQGVTSFVVGNNAYLYGGYNQTDATSYANIWRFSEDSGWVRMSAKSTTVRLSYATSFVVENRVFIMGGIKNKKQSREVWEYLVDLDSLVQKADFPGIIRIEALGFTLKNNGHIAFGFNKDSSRRQLNDIWRYNHHNDTWKRVYAGKHLNCAAVFTHNDAAYFRSENEGEEQSQKFWKYDTINYLTEVAPFEGKWTAAPVYFTTDSFGYYGTGVNNAYLGDFWRYDFQNNTWQKVVDLPIGRNNATAFTINNKGYVFGGFNASDFEDTLMFLKDLWMLDYGSTGVREAENPIRSFAYPNPSSGVLYFSSVITKLSLYSLAGNLIWSKSVQKSPLDISGEKSGTYILVAETGEEIIRQKLIIQ